MRFRQEPREPHFRQLSEFVSLFSEIASYQYHTISVFHTHHYSPYVSLSCAFFSIPYSSVRFHITCTPQHYSSVFTSVVWKIHHHVHLDFQYTSVYCPLYSANIVFRIHQDSVPFTIPYNSVLPRPFSILYTSVFLTLLCSAHFATPYTSTFDKVQHSTHFSTPYTSTSSKVQSSAFHTLHHSVRQYFVHFSIL